MTLKILALAVRLYRANPARPHCDGAAGMHVLACRLVTALLPAAILSGIGGEGYDGCFVKNPARQWDDLKPYKGRH